MNVEFKAQGNKPFPEIKVRKWEKRNQKNILKGEFT